MTTPGAPGGTPELVVVPAIPDAGALANQLNTPAGLLATVNDLYTHLSATAEALQSHVSSSGITHDMMD